jgi:hypothetical protein
VLLLQVMACESAETTRDAVIRDRAGLEACTKARVECAERAQSIVANLRSVSGSVVDMVYEKARASANAWCDRQAARLKMEKVLVASEAEFDSQVRPAVDAFLKHPVTGTRDAPKGDELAKAAASALEQLRQILEQRRSQIIDEEVRRLTQVLADMHWPGIQELARESAAAKGAGTR